jgi:hypothetical protein
MAFTGNYTCNSFKVGLPKGLFNFNTGTTDTFYIALYTNNATLTDLTTAYTSGGESSGGSYVSGGALLTISQVPTIGTTTGSPAYWSFADVTWTGAITARGALIYKPGADGAVCVLDFGADKTSASTFVVRFPTPTSTSAIIRIS